MSHRTAWRNITVVLSDHPGALADLGETLGAAGVSIEGGGLTTHAGVAVANFLVDDADTAAAALHQRGIGPTSIDEVVTVRLDQDLPGQLGAFTRQIADAGIAIRVQYSDHDHRLVLVVPPDHHDRCQELAHRWPSAPEPTDTHGTPPSGDPSPGGTAATGGDQPGGAP